MTNPLSMDFIKALVKKQELKGVAQNPIFTVEELKLVKKVLKAGEQHFSMRGKNFKVRYFVWHKTNWVTVRPTMGFVPMFSAPLDEALKAEVI
jgi:hypothetical protein